MVSRRGLLGGLLFTPAVVSFGSLMRVRLVAPVLWGDGVHDDTAAIQWLIDHAKDHRVTLPEGSFWVQSPVRLPANFSLHSQGESPFIRGVSFITRSGLWRLTEKHTLIAVATPPEYQGRAAILYGCKGSSAHEQQVYGEIQGESPVGWCVGIN